MFYDFYMIDWKCTNRTYNVHIVYINSNNKIYDADNWNIAKYSIILKSVPCLLVSLIYFQQNIQNISKILQINIPV